MKPSQELLDRVLRLAQEAGERVLEIYHGGFSVTHKEDHSPLTQADLAAHHHILAGLQALSPELPVLSEEAADIPWDTRRHWTRYWLVDPLDGTKEFIKRNGEFTVNIALIDDGRPVLGVVHAPVLQQGWIAAEGCGAWRVEQGQRQAIRTRRVPQRPVLLVSKSHRNPALELFLQRMPPHEAISRGSSLKFCLIAEGSADLHPRTGPTSEWDTAAGHCIVEQAGGEVRVMPGFAPLRYNQKESLLNPDFAVIGDPDYDWARRM
ncbi:MAG TPA: 3'(2'),5'-bisphosphate nucleotidase CysQ [Solimonas sp.]|nr:3'(2'),5'-bisphosphate nucleotidase CysQ [Solimonas sp.]